MAMRCDATSESLLSALSLPTTTTPSGCCVPPCTHHGEASTPRLFGALRVKASDLAFGSGNDGVLDVVNLLGGTDHHWLSLVLVGGWFASMRSMVVSRGGKIGGGYSSSLLIQVLFLKASTLFSLFDQVCKRL